jgi:hypothetical protein
MTPPFFSSSLGALLGGVVFAALPLGCSSSGAGNASADAGPGASVSSEFEGTLTFTRGGVDEGIAMANIDLRSRRLTAPRQLLGIYGNRNVRGEFAFTARCGVDNIGYAVYIADSAGTPTDTVIPCADHNESVIDVEFALIRLSPDGTRLTVQPSFASYSPLSTFVYSRAGEELARFENYVNANWTIDGRLLLVGEGLWLTDGDLANLSRVDGGQIIAAMGSPAPHPDGQRLAFQYTGGIYQMSLDGSGFGKLYENSEIAYAPAWSPDGQALAFLLSDGIGAERAIYFYDTVTQRTSSWSTETVFEEDFVSRFPFGPLSWNAP